jgi:hypothetical protein
MLYKPFKAGTMQRIRRPLYLLATFTLLVSSCQSNQALNVDRQTMAGEIPVVSALIDSPSQDNPDIAENNECLKCHSDKDRLIETAKPEEPVESESKGVG